MNKICTSIEQSKKLIELGIDVNTADMLYSLPIITHYDENDEYYRELPSYKVINTRCNIIEDNKFDEPLPIRKDDIPAWSLSALMNLLPSEFTEVVYSTTTYVIKIRKYKFTDEINLHQIAYGSYRWHEDGGYTWKDMINTGEKEELLDAAFEMVCWLKENNKL